MNTSLSRVNVLFSYKCHGVFMSLVYDVVKLRGSGSCSIVMPRPSIVCDHLQQIALNLPGGRQKTLVLSKQCSTGFNGYPVCHLLSATGKFSAISCIVCVTILTKTLLEYIQYTTKKGTPQRSGTSRAGGSKFEVVGQKVGVAKVCDMGVVNAQTTTSI